MNKALRLQGLSGSATRSEAKNFYMNKYFNLFMNAFEWEGIDDEQKDFIMRRFWSEGTVAAFKVKGADILAFAPYAPAMWNIYDFPTKVTLINKRGVSFIPNTFQDVDKDVVLGYVQRNRKGVGSVVNMYAEKIADAEITIKQSLRSLRCPWLIATTPENEAKMHKLFDLIEQGEYKLFVSTDDINALKVLNGTSQFNVDKLFAYKCALENELREYLGIDNLGVNEKKEHLITAEIGANDEITNIHQDIFIDTLKEFCGRIRDVLGFDVSVTVNKPDVDTKLNYEDEEIENESE